MTGASSARPAQEPAALEARSLLDELDRLDRAEPVWQTELARYQLCYRGGALAEAQRAVDALRRIDPAHPQPALLQAQLDSHAPERRDRLVSDLDSLLARDEQEPGALNDAQRSWLGALRDRLLREDQRSASLRSSTLLAQLAPAGALLALAALIGLHLRSTRRP